MCTNLYKQKISSGSKNLTALILINNIVTDKTKTRKNSKRPKGICMKKSSLKYRNDESARVDIFSGLLLTEKFRHYIRMNATAYY